MVECVVVLHIDNFGAVRPGLERVDKFFLEEKKKKKKDGRGPNEKVNGRSEG